ncbi:MAG: hypothetical protein JO257_10490 [Deltaproteobacteria bacterium]|nr:hypothetical protein [Deltaproteobacteria bacterium]
MRQVRGILFLDYVRMIKANKSTDWGLPDEDMRWVGERIDKDGWYPMASFERMGNAILRHVAGGQLNAVYQWGRMSAAQLAAAHPMLLAKGDPVETINRFRVLRATYFDFEALQVPMLHDGEAQIVIHYYMGMPAEEAASLQTQGFFEGLLGLAGAREIRSTFKEKSWAGAPRTLLDLRWDP